MQATADITQESLVALIKRMKKVNGKLELLAKKFREQWQDADTLVDEDDDGLNTPESQTIYQRAIVATDALELAIAHVFSQKT
jgi:hypothetical protein